MMKRIGTCALVAGLWAASAGLAQARCERSDYNAVPQKNSRSTVRMTASSGKECVLRLTASRRVVVTARRIAAPPAHGKATIEGETVFYRSFPGYQVPDGFVAEIEVRSADGDGVSTQTVSVTVED
jgi:hypothetical protein